MQGRVEFFEIDSAALQGNPLGDPTRREVLVYAPAQSANAALPVTLLLPAYGSNHRTFLNYDLWQPSVLEQLDAAIARGACLPTLLVIADCRTCWGGSQFVNSPASGNYQDFLVDEVLPAVDQRYKTIADARGRAVVGRSSGGFGALRLAMDRPGVVAAVGSIAGDAAFELSLRPLLLKAQLAFERSGSVAAFCERLRSEGPTRSDDYDAAFLLAAAAAYAPQRTEHVPFAPMPLHHETGVLNEALWSAWCKADPCALIESAHPTLRKLRVLHVEAGRFDEYGLQYAARQIAARARAFGIPVTHEEFEGGHRGTRARYLQVIPRLLESLQK